MCRGRASLQGVKQWSKGGGRGQPSGDREEECRVVHEWSFEGDTLLLSVNDGVSRAGSMTQITTCVNQPCMCVN